MSNKISSSSVLFLKKQCMPAKNDNNFEVGGGYTELEYICCRFQL